MPNAKPLPDAAYLRECFDYDPVSGVVLWRVRPRAHFTSNRGWNSTNTQKAGTAAGIADKHGRIRTCIEGEHVSLARVIWKLVTGLEPIGEIDHEDTDPANNRWRNLREATYSQSAANRSHPNSHGFKGVSNEPHGKGFVARVRYKGKTHYAGRADTAAEAYKLYQAKARQLHGAFHHP